MVVDHMIEFNVRHFLTFVHIRLRTLTLQEEAAPCSLEVNWRKTLVHSLGWSRDEAPGVFIYGHNVQRFEEFMYLGSVIHLTCSSEPEIRKCSAMT